MASASESKGTKGVSDGPLSEGKRSAGNMHSGDSAPKKQKVGTGGGRQGKGRKLGDSVVETIGTFGSSTKSSPQQRDAEASDMSFTHE